MDLTDSVSSGLAAVVKQRHVSQTVAVVDVAAALQDLKEREKEGEKERDGGMEREREKTQNDRHVSSSHWRKKISINFLS